MTPMIMNPFRFGSVAASTEFASMYESRSALTTVQKQHFVEWFSGSALDSIWTSNVSGTGTNTMYDSVDGGFRLLFSTGTNNSNDIDFGDKRQYEETGSVFIAVCATNLDYAQTNHFCDIGFTGQTFRDSVDLACANYHTGQTYIRLLTRRSSDTFADSTVTGDNTRRSIKLFLDTSDVELFIDGVTQATNTTTLPNVKLQPFAQAWHGTGGVASGIDVNYMECYNT